MHELEQIYRGEIVDPLGELLLAEGFQKSGLKYWLRVNGTVTAVSFDPRRRSGDGVRCQPSVDLLHRWLNRWVDTYGGLDPSNPRAPIVEARRLRLLRINCDIHHNFETMRPRAEFTGLGWTFCDTSGAIGVRREFENLLPMAIAEARLMLKDEWYYEDCRDCALEANPDRWIPRPAQHFVLMAMTTGRWDDVDAGVRSFENRDPDVWGIAAAWRQELGSLAEAHRPR